MRPLRILIIENDEEWRSLIKERLHGLSAKFHEAETKAQAESLAQDNSYDLITVDLSLVSGSNSPDAAEDGLAILDQLRRSHRNREAGVLVLTGLPSTSFPRFDQILRLRQAHRLLTKAEFEEKFVSVVQEVLREARLTTAEEARARSVGPRTLSISFLEDCWIGCRLSGDRRSDYFASRPVKWNSEDSAKSGDHLGTLQEQEWSTSAFGKLWRGPAKDLGTKIFSEIKRDEEIARLLSAARDGSREGEPLTLRFVGPTQGLSVPFELLRDENDYLAFDNVITRQLVGVDLPLSYPEPSLVQLLRGLKGAGKALRILLVGADATGTNEFLDSVSEEVDRVQEIAELELQSRQGIRLRIDRLVGEEATAEAVKEALEEECHILHYAGHGGYDPKNPESSGPILFKDRKAYPLSAPELRRLAQDSQLRLAFLNCCQTAQTAANSGQGDFYGALDAMAKAGVPWVLAHRWKVLDRSAIRFAELFYLSLWWNFDPGLAVRNTRRQIAEDEPLKRNDSIWASSILVSQGE